MNGKTHLQLGVTSSIATAIVAGKIMNNDLIAICGVVLSPLCSIITSQLPDIDSKNSRISKKIPIVNFLKKESFFLTGVILLLISVVLKHMLYLEFQTISYLMIIGAIILLLHFFAVIFLKHRKLTHCILSCIIITMVSFIPYYKVNNLIFYCMGIGFTTGYISHIVYDCFTVRGCPLFYPLSKKAIKLGKLKSNNKEHEKLVMNISYGIIVLSILYYLGLFDFLISLNT